MPFQWYLTTSPLQSLQPRLHYATVVYAIGVPVKLTHSLQVHWRCELSLSRRGACACVRGSGAAPQSPTALQWCAHHSPTSDSSQYVCRMPSAECRAGGVCVFPQADWTPAVQATGGGPMTRDEPPPPLSALSRHQSAGRGGGGCRRPTSRPLLWTADSVSADCRGIVRRIRNDETGRTHRDGRRDRVQPKDLCQHVMSNRRDDSVRDL